VESITVRIMGKAGCHLCDEAEIVVAEVAADYANVSIEHALLDDRPEWVVQYSDKIPVIHVNGDEVAYWRIRPETLRAELDSRGGIPATKNSG
jgi:glutaredoxin